ncbi:MAG: GtrA family protein, partial [Thermoplasmatota archaeon]
MLKFDTKIKRKLFAADQELLQQIFRFVIVGIISTALNYSIFFVLQYILKVDYLLSYVSGYFFGFLLGFYLNKKWTFLSDKPFSTELVKYFIVYTFSLFLGTLLFRTQVLIFGFSTIYSNFVTTIFTAIFNFLSLRYFVFRTLKRKELEFFLYHKRFLINYIVIGFFSILVEVLFIMLIQKFLRINLPLISVAGFIIGLIVSYLLNATLNFKVPKERNIRTFRTFIIISVFSYSLNFLLLTFLKTKINYPYVYFRFLTAAILFMIAYTLHRRFTFTNIKKIGVAIYMRPEENLDEIFKKVGEYPDFIHLDLVDETFNENANKIDISAGYKVRNILKNTPIFTHIMSKNLSYWVAKVSPFSDVIIIEYSKGKDFLKVIKELKLKNKKVGVSIRQDLEENELKNVLKIVDYVQILGIEKPGMSGQLLNKNSIDLLNKIKRIKLKNKPKIIFDGGVRLENINNIDAEFIVSASTILNSTAPVKTMFELKNNAKYHKRDEVLKNFLKEKIFEIARKYNFIQSLNIVGSFSEGKEIFDLGDIDVVVIVDKLNFDKYNKIISEFGIICKYVESNFCLKTFINPTFGPLKFNDQYDVVFHVMIYDIESHIRHCLKSPFTTRDWEKTKLYEKKHLSEVAKTLFPQPIHLLNSYRSINSYISDIENGVITYKEYNFKKDAVLELKLKKDMNENDKINYAYHIMKFTMLNFIKVYSGSNLLWSKKVLKKFFKASKLNAKYLKLFNKLESMKKKKKERLAKEDIKKLKEFLEESKSAVFRTFYLNSKKILVMRH